MASIVNFYPGKPPEPASHTSLLQLEDFHISKAGGFDMGYPEPGVAYVRHPIKHERLITFADYHPQIMIEKVNEAIGMLTALGASSIELAYTNSTSSDIRSEVELMFGIVRLGTSVSKGETHTVVYTARGAGSAPRNLPSLLWIDQPGWRGIIDGRLNARQTQFAVTFTYEHRSGVNAELAAAVRKVGLSVGGEFRKAHKVSFSLKGEFPDDAGAFRRR